MSHVPQHRISRRRLLAGAGGAAALGVIGARHPSVARAAARAASGEQPTLSQWYHEYGEAGVLEAVERYASEYPDADVSVEWIPGDYTSALTAALLTDDSPDVFEFGNGPSIDMIQAGQVVPLDGILGDAESDFNERMINRLSFDGHLWAVPQVIDMQFVVYRTSMLEDAGVEPPTNMDELIAAAGELTGDGVQGLFLGNDGGAGLLGGPLLWSAGGDYLTDNFEPGFTTPEVYENFAKAAELYSGDSLLLGAPTDWFDPSAFIQGLTAIQMTGLWTIPQIAEALGDDFGVIPWPALSADAGVPSVPIGAFSSSVTASAADPDAAKAFVKWLWVDGVDYQVDFALSYGFHIPSRNSLANDAEPLAEGAAAEAVRLSQEHGFTQTPILWSPDAQTAYSDACVRIIQQGADPEEELAVVAEVTEQEIDRILGGASTTSDSTA